jgi:hypothetical protein
MDPLIDPGEYAALAYCTYLNQASLGLIPCTSLEASVRGGESAGFRSGRHTQRLEYCPAVDAWSKQP